MGNDFGSEVIPGASEKSLEVGGIGQSLCLVCCVNEATCLFDEEGLRVGSNLWSSSRIYGASSEGRSRS